MADGDKFLIRSSRTGSEKLKLIEVVSKEKVRVAQWADEESAV